MAVIQLTISDPLNQFAEAQAMVEGFGSANDYVAALLQEAQRHRIRQEMEAAALEGLNSGPPIEANDQFWEEKRNRFLARHPEALHGNAIHQL